MRHLPVLAPADADAWDLQAEAAGIPRELLMECAGRAAAVVLAERFPEALRAGVLIAAGAGNNGGDGWVVARALHRLDVPVWVAPLASAGAGLSGRVAERARAEGVRVVAPDGPWPGVGLALDAVLGTGAKGAPRPPAAALLDRLRQLPVPLVALDGPTGVDLLTGATHGLARADLTITFSGLRRGHLLARDEVGTVVVVDIGHPPPDPTWPALVTDDVAAALLPAFRADAHKGNRGRVVIVGGDAGMAGAIRLAGRAAFAAGAGLVHAVAPAETVQALVAAEPDLQTLVQPLDRPPTDALLELIARADSVVVGPGLGRGPGRRELVAALLQQARTAVLDADGLIAWQGATADLAALCLDRRVVLTPHPGEFRALFPAAAGFLEVDPWAAAAAAAEAVGTTVLLKGVPTVVARPGRRLATVAVGTPGLATGGSGDMLSGFIATALAQGLEPETAAALGAQVLGRAGERAAQRRTAHAMRPMDVLDAAPELYREWADRRNSGPAVRPPVLWVLERPETW